MKSYETEQKKLLEALFCANPDRFYTVEEIATILRADSDDVKCSVSTVYRLISRLSEEGIVHKHARDGSRKFYYQYVSAEACRDHLHLKCEGCGRLYHMDDETSERVLRDVLSSSGFSVDEAKTVLSGICSSCRRQGERP